MGPAVAHFRWGRDDLDTLAGAVVAGDVVECGPHKRARQVEFLDAVPKSASGKILRRELRAR